MSNRTPFTLESLQKLTMTLSDYLRQNGNPHYSVVVNGEGARLMCSEMQTINAPACMNESYRGATGQSQETKSS